MNLFLRVFVIGHGCRKLFLSINPMAVYMLVIQIIEFDSMRNCFAIIEMNMVRSLRAYMMCIELMTP